MDSETRRIIKEEIRAQMNIILQAVSQGSTGQKEDIVSLYPGMPTNPSRPVMHPFGLMSSTPDGLLSVVARQGEDSANRLILGHRDKNAPDVSKVKGETILYDSHGGTLVFRKPGFEVKKNDIQLMEELINLLTTIINARTNTMLGPQRLRPNPSSPGGLSGRETFVGIRDRLITMKGGVDGA